MHHVRSLDGTRIGFTRRGAGAPLVLVHGISADATRWAPVAAELEKHFTVFAVDRRGRGMSSDGPEYSFAREFEDLAAVLAAASAAAFLFGHSFGGVCALGALALSREVRKVVVYEPYVPVTPALEPSAATKRYEAMDSNEEILTTFLREIIQLSAAEVEAMRAHPSWASRLSCAHTIPRELRAAEAFAFADGQLATLDCRVDFLVGGESPAFLKDATARLRAHLPSARAIVLEGQKHSAMNTAPSLFVRALLDAFGR
jgi:pimeloyl-ACP methyl ester carboxylesterase